MINVVTERTERSAIRVGDVVKGPITGDIFLVLASAEEGEMRLATLYVNNAKERAERAGMVVHYPKSMLVERFNGTLEVTSQ